MQGALAPFFASGALFGGYLLIKFFPDLNIETFLNAYFWLVGSIAVAGAAASPLRSLVSAQLSLEGTHASEVTFMTSKSRNSMIAEIVRKGDAMSCNLCALWARELQLIVGLCLFTWICV